MKLQAEKTACLTLDVQNGIFQFLPEAAEILPKAEQVVQLARKKNFRLIHVGLGFNEGYPEVPDDSTFGSRIKPSGFFIKGSPTAEFHSKILQKKDLIIYKQRVGGFSENELHMVLRSQGIENLILFGIATSGIVLSTLRQAFDLDYKCIVIKDACHDRDEEVHRVLTEKIFPVQATVMNAQEFVTTFGG